MSSEFWNGISSFTSLPHLLVCFQFIQQQAKKVKDIQLSFVFMLFFSNYTVATADNLILIKVAHSRQ